MINRRQFVATTAAAALLPGPAPAASGSADAALEALLQRHAELFLRRSPEEATSVGFDTGADAALRGRLDDRSLAARARDRAAVAQARVQLAAIDPRALSPRAALDRDVADFTYATLADMLGRPGYMDLNLRPSPYLVNQMNGAYYWLPGLIGGAPIRTAADVDFWHARLAALGPALDGETERVRHDAAAGVAPPGFVIDRTVTQLRALRDAPPRGSALMADAIARARAGGLPDPAPRAEAIFAQVVAPALDRQMAALAALRGGASDIAGVWRLPDGEAYYAAALRANTTVSGLRPGALHQQGLDQCAALTAKLDAALRAQGMTQGSVSARLAALNVDRRFLVADDDAGRARLLEAARGEIAKVTALLPRAFNDPVVDPLAVRPIPDAIAGGSPGAFYSDGAEGVGAAFQLNLQRTDDLALWRLPTLAHHEGVPGHHFQYGMARHAGLPLFRRIVRFSAYTEGWALYAEQVADEIGAHADDPFGHIGFLQSQLFRAARIVVDTGLHHHRWTRDQATQWMVDHAGEVPAATAREVVRYCVYPGQACSFTVGANAIVAAREAARARLGPRFDVRAFHDLVLRSGPMPLDVLAAAAARLDLPGAAAHSTPRA